MEELVFENSDLWQSAFGGRTKDRHASVRKTLKQKFVDLREKVGVLVSQITKDVPGLTVHDLTHLDALWETASLVAGKNLKINRAEAYVLGAAVLLHDAGMCLAAYPNGLTDLRRTVEWRDTVTSLLQQTEGTVVSEEALVNPPDTILKIVVGEVLRLLHAQRAKELPFLEWKDSKGRSEPLIEDINLRTFYGPLIGKIAYSHHVSVAQLEALLGNRLGAYPDFPSEWTVDPITLACLLRCADAAHIDERRAPRFLNTLIRPSGKSAEHWIFQGKLAKARLETDALVYTSGPEFELDDAESWWLCFDTIAMIDGELNGVDVLLENLGRGRFAAKRARAAESPEALAKYVRTKGWTPVDTKLRVSDVPRLVRLFGGAHLYGNDLRIPVRELVQNSSDAIRAKRLLEGLGESYGTVVMRIKKEPDGYWLEVEDDGLGMSERTMTGSLLDFGRSFWTSDAIKLEFPGLVAKGMAATGRFGVGFFSVFMLGDVVRVTSNRYDAALEAAKNLEFRSGLEARPILRNTVPSERLPGGGTRVSVRLRDDPYADGGWLARKEWHNKIHRLSLRLVMGPLCPNLDVRLSVDEGESAQPYSAPNDWITIEGKKLLARLDRADDAAEKRELSVYGQQLRTLVGKDQTILGRACIWGVANTWSESHGCVTVGGLAAARLTGIGGVLLGAAETIARDSAMPFVSADVLSTWATEQANILSQSSLSSSDKMNALAFVLQCGGEPAELPLIRRGNEYLNADQFREELSHLDSIDIFAGEEVEYDEDSDSCHPREFREQFECDKTIFLVRQSMPTVLTVGSRKWPQCVIEPAYPTRPKSYEAIVRSIVAEVWGKDFTKSDDEKRVGVVDGSPIERSVTTLFRQEYDPADEPVT